MKYYKFKKIQKGDYPIIRVTFKPWHGGLIEKDICKSTVKDHWVFMEDGSHVNRSEPINNFYNNELDCYWVNG
jgi:hypothetical protein